jgi:hypothetical protein
VRHKILVPVDESGVVPSSHDGLAESDPLTSVNMAERRTEDDDMLTVGRFLNS